MRLKGGDPAVFSRASSELAALVAAGVAYELVPGISSVLAAPLLAVGGRSLMYLMEFYQGRACRCLHSLL